MVTTQHAEEEPIIPPPTPLPELPPNTHHGHQDKRHANFVSRCNEDALLDFGTFSVTSESVSETDLKDSQYLSLTDLKDSQFETDLKDSQFEDAREMACEIVDSILERAFREESEPQVHTVSSDSVFEEQVRSGGSSDHIEHEGSDHIEQGSDHIEHEGSDHIEHEGSDHIEHEESDHIEQEGSDHTYSVSERKQSDHGESSYLGSQTTMKPRELTHGEAAVLEDDCDRTVEDNFVPTNPKVNINILSSVHYPTKLLTGVVSIDDSYNIASLTLSLLCEGTQTIGWKSSGGDIFETQTFFTEYVDLVYKDDPGSENLNFSFSFQLPPNLPSSFRYIQHDGDEVCGVIEYAFILLDIKENQMIARRILNLCEAPPYCYKPLQKSDSMKIYYLTCINRGLITLKAELDKGCYYFGEVAQIRCCVLNEASEAISNINVTLCRYLQFKDGNFTRRKQRDVIHHHKFTDAEGTCSKNSYETVLAFEMKEAGTQSVANSQLINCSFVVRVAIRTKGGHDLFVDLDVVLYSGVTNAGQQIQAAANKAAIEIVEDKNSIIDDMCRVSSSSSSSDGLKPELDDGQSTKLEEPSLPGNKKITDNSSELSSTCSSGNLIGKNLSENHEDKKDDLEIGLDIIESDEIQENRPGQDDTKSSTPIEITLLDKMLEGELPLFPEDYVPSSDDDSELSARNIIVSV